MSFPSDRLGEMTQSADEEQAGRAREDPPANPQRQAAEARFARLVSELAPMVDDVLEQHGIATMGYWAVSERGVRVFVNQPGEKGYKVNGTTISGLSAEAEVRPIESHDSAWTIRVSGDEQGEIAEWRVGLEYRELRAGQGWCRKVIAERALPPTASRWDLEEALVDIVGELDRWPGPQAL